MSELGLLDVIELEEIDNNLFRGMNNFPTPWGRVFGGQVLAQSLNAARRTVPEDRVLHSMHAYFILGGKLDHPIVYQVDPIRNGGSFNTRRVVAYQKGQAIFNMSASFQVKEEGFEHQIEMPKVESYKNLQTDLEWVEQYKETVPQFYNSYQSKRFVEFRPVENFDILKPEASPPIRNIWIKCDEKLPDNSELHKQILAFASDYNLMTTALLPHQGKFRLDKMQMASLDHAMWFHDDFKTDEWLLYALDSPFASNSRGFNRGNFFTAEGKLVASVVQEGLIRSRG